MRDPILERVITMPKLPALGGTLRIGPGHIALIEVAYDRWFKHWLECGIVDAAELAMAIPHLCQEIELAWKDPEKLDRIIELEEQIDDLECEKRDLRERLERHEG